ncbi:MAG: right-handed parallel beta-helix repeat-containing protein [Piscinibacter sp.]|nr:right-handed parallel beta-helix repeat-containing protein [Piscinibacter sp.]
MGRLLLGLALTGAVALAVAIELAQAPPRLVARYLEQRALGHANAAGDLARQVGHLLIRADRGEPLLLMPPLRLGAQSGPAASAPAGRRVDILLPEELSAALERAEPGDVITLAPGLYRFSGEAINVVRPGTAERRIVVRAEQAGSVRLEFDLREGFVVDAPYWTFENLTIRGVCADHERCEHAFHVIGRAHHFESRNNAIHDFNAHFKINASTTAAPDHGLIEGSTLANDTARRTSTPVAPIDLVTASHWTVRGNLIRDFVKADPALTSYGAFAKGGGSGNRFERNVILCEARVRGAPGSRVGLSLGGGGTGAGYCRGGRCIVEHDEGRIESNLIAFCSDSGIYLNRAARSRVLHNTLIDTAGIAVRFAESSAEVEGNLVDGIVQARDDGLLRERDNRATGLLRLYAGSHPVRALFTDPVALDFSWRSAAPRREEGTSTDLPGRPDLCGTPRPAAPAYGAFEDFRACAATR